MNNSTFALPAPICNYGYPQSQLIEILGKEKTEDFFYWMRGQTISDCNGTIYEPRLKNMVPSNCGPHGWVFYTSDVKRFLAGLPVID